MLKILQVTDEERREYFKIEGKTMEDMEAELSKMELIRHYYRQGKYIKKTAEDYD